MEGPSECLRQGGPPWGQEAHICRQKLPCSHVTESAVVRSTSSAAWPIGCSSQPNEVCSSYAAWRAQPPQFVLFPSHSPALARDLCMHFLFVFGFVVVVIVCYGVLLYRPGWP